ncbi:uncharacterized protein QC764_710370 [Podospora pseudoanserina]|uniref:Nephrocystin 3-like N-terminal domain-containing protein n=1 Tax=Podospora pseudoanserina TaxID=2609844 RepID=A0ABR0HLT6_9PEZI|nr:hypothetical protein QC764_710370 [Podospora pseudoanserina]
MAAISRDKIPAIGLTVIHEPEGEANLDVVFVHGFTGHPVRTWTHNGGSERLDQASEPPPKARKVNLFSRPHEQKKSTPSSASVYWPQDLLPKNLPHARVATFGYDTNIRHRHVGPVLNKSTIYDMAKDFLYRLEALRRSNSSRPLLFIAHSLGGIMVKEALRQAYNNQNRHIQLRQTFDSTIGILFFGTPHGGADPRGLVVGIIERLAKGLGFEANQHVLNTLLPDSECRQLRDEFNPVLQDQNWIIYSFQEGLALSGLGQKVVENSSSCLNFPKTEMTISIGKDHREMCVYDPQYQKVAAALDRIAEQVSVSPSTSDVGLSASFPDEQEPAEAISLDHQSIQTLLDSLRFEQIDSRQESIRVAHKNTCVWVTKTREYKDWLDINKMEDHHGFLWMRGKAGSGKSTLIKSTLRSFQNSKSSKGTTVIHFFFNARGAELEKTTRGMYRALLVQLLEILQKKMPHFQRDVFKSAAIKTWNVREGREWSVAILEELFENAILSIGQEEVTCFIDALDECDDEQVEPMIRLFERIGEQVVSNGLRFRIFFSSRPYPDISLDTCLNLLLDGQEGHVRDIKTYIQKELRAGDQQTKDQLLLRASGIFMWTVLVVDILNKEKRKGTPNHLVTKKLKKIPGDLWELFKSILNRDQEDKDQLLLCIQWLLFTRKPLGPEEFYHALLAGIETDDDSVFEDNSESDDYEVLGENSDSEHSPGFHVQSDPDKDSHSLDEGTSATGDALRATVPDIPRFIRSISKGLAEITQSKKAPVVQFIHESVRDFLLKEEKRGVRVVWPELGDDFEAQSHDRLKQCCFQYYMRSDILTILSVGFDIALPQASAEEGRALRVKATETFPFLGYATLNVLWHAECAQTAQVGAISQQGFLNKDFDLRTWLLLRNVLEVHEARRYNSTYTASLLYVLAELNVPALIRISLPSSSGTASIITEKERYGSPVLAAIVSQSRGAVDAFVDHLAALQQIPPSTVGGWRSETGTHSSLSTIGFRFSQKRVLLSYAAEYGDVALCHLVGRILGHEEVNKRDQEGRTPLWYAALGGHSDVAKVLCQEGADPNIVEKNNISPLLSAANKGHLKVVECLYREGANIEASYNFGTTPISRASKAGHVDIVKFLCEKGADINKPDSTKRGPISYASEGGHTAIVSFLVREGADLYAKDVHQNIPAVYAVKKGHMDCLKILVSSDSDFEAKNKWGETMLMMAVKGGNQKMVEWLLEHGASAINLRDERGRTPFSYAVVSYKGQDMVKFLLSTGKVEIDSKDNNGRTPLSCATMVGGRH